ncbi:MAG: translation initiation factor IF-3 [bacterium]|nr:translation initiation factor IF-3 [bacterium]MDZ4231462.1 translation initiation factor IF-3 [Patescibacteria group bacterium]
MAKTKHYSKALDLKVNDQIRAPKLRVLGEDGENMGVLSLDEAKDKAKELGLDLVLITEKSNPPIARVISYDKFRYQKEKELKKQQQRVPDSKRIQISPREGPHDLSFKLKRLEEFLQAGHKVEIQVTLRGREKGMKDFARGKLEEFLSKVQTPHKVTRDVQSGGRGLLTQIEPTGQA